MNRRFRRDCSRSWFPAFGRRVHPVWESGIHDVDLAVWCARSPARRVYAVECNVSGHLYPGSCVLAAALAYTVDVVAGRRSHDVMPFVDAG